MEQTFPRITYAEWGCDLLRLTKPRLGLLVLFATAAGFCMASAQTADRGRLICALLGTALVSGGAAVLNQALETRWDGLMTRTCNRPLPTGRVTRPAAFVLGTGVTMGGLGCLALETTLLATCLAALAFVVYLAGYTPMKRQSPACVLVGAIAGAMPPVIGWAAVDGSLQWESGLLFGVLFTWQMPHLLSIAWMHREDYTNAGFALVPANDASGRVAALQALVFSGLLVALTFVPALMGSAGAAYFIGVILLAGVLLTCASLFLWDRSRESARRLFVVSIAYLPAFLTLLLLARR